MKIPRKIKKGAIAYVRLHKGDSKNYWQLNTKGNRLFDNLRYRLIDKILATHPASSKERKNALLEEYEIENRLMYSKKNRVKYI